MHRIRTAGSATRLYGSETNPGPAGRPVQWKPLGGTAVTQTMDFSEPCSVFGFPIAASVFRCPLLTEVDPIGWTGIANQ